MRDRLRPCVDDIRIKVDLLTAYGLPRGLSHVEHTVFMRLVAFSACDMVWTYSPPGDGWLQLDGRTYRLTGLSPGKWRRVWKGIRHLFDELDGWIKPREEWFSIVSVGEARPPVPASVRSFVMQRDAYRCVYCGNEKGPFDLDHVIPYSRGGSNTDPENLVCACSSCNRTKRARTPEEWVAA